MNADTLLLLMLLAVCGALIRLDMLGVSLSSLIRRAVLARRVQKNLSLGWKTAWRITGGQRC